jgi:hypothetical protein
MKVYIFINVKTAVASSHIEISTRRESSVPLGQIMVPVRTAANKKTDPYHVWNSFLVRTGPLTNLELLR